MRNRRGGERASWAAIVGDAALWVLTPLLLEAGFLRGDLLDVLLARIVGQEVDRTRDDPMQHRNLLQPPV